MYKDSRSSHIFKTIGLASVGLLVATMRVDAAGTAAGQVVSNQATVDYKVGTVDQTQETSNLYTFVVDRKINLTVSTTDGAEIPVTPGTVDNVLTFEVENLGNGIQDFALSAVPGTSSTKFGGTDNINADAVIVRVESGANAGYLSAEDTETWIDELAADGTSTVYIVGDFSTLTLNDGDIASYHLVAEARIHGGVGALGGTLTQTTVADTTGTEDIVFADGIGTETVGDISRGADFSDQSDFEISAADLTVDKVSLVISDPTNGTTLPKAIPGAVVEYTITISNAAGAATATDISFSDSLNAEIVTTPKVSFELNGYDTAKGIRVTAPNINTGNPLDLTNANDGDVGNWNVTATNTVTVTGIVLTAGQSATIQFRVLILPVVP